MRWKYKIKILYTITILSAFMTMFFFLYPTVSDAWNRYTASKIIYDYIYSGTSKIEKLDLYNKAVKYNQRLYKRGIDYNKLLQDKQDLYYESMLNTHGNSVMGYVTIEDIHVSLPIYHYAIEEVLAKGVGHLYGTSLPVGGKNTHSVLTGHCGLVESKLFTDLEELKYGDVFSVTILGKTLYYQIDQIKTVLPDELQDLKIVKGKDLITLITCTPYGINTHRLLVRGHRVSTIRKNTKKKSLLEKVEDTFYIPHVIFGLSFMIVLGTLILIIKVWRK